MARNRTRNHEAAITPEDLATLELIRQGLVDEKRARLLRASLARLEALELAWPASGGMWVALNPEAPPEANQRKQPKPKAARVLKQNITVRWHPSEIERIAAHGPNLSDAMRNLVHRGLESSESGTRKRTEAPPSAPEEDAPASTGTDGRAGAIGQSGRYSFAAPGVVRRRPR